MKRKRFTEEQIIGVLMEHKLGAKKGRSVPQAQDQISEASTTGRANSAAWTYPKPAERDADMTAIPSSGRGMGSTYVGTDVISVLQAIFCARPKAAEAIGQRLTKEVSFRNLNAPHKGLGVAPRRRFASVEAGP
jgi:hypothetical protein